MRLLLRIFMSLRFLLLLASVGALLGGVLMLSIGMLELTQAVSLFSSNFDHIVPRQFTILVLNSIDAFLFGVVLSIFGYAVTFSFIFDVPPHMHIGLPPINASTRGESAQTHTCRSGAHRSDRRLWVQCSRG